MRSSTDLFNMDSPASLWHDAPEELVQNGLGITHDYPSPRGAFSRVAIRDQNGFFHRDMRREVSNESVPKSHRYRKARYEYPPSSSPPRNPFLDDEQDPPTRAGKTGDPYPAKRTRPHRDPVPRQLNNTMVDLHDHTSPTNTLTNSFGSPESKHHTDSPASTIWGSVNDNHDNFEHKRGADARRMGTRRAQTYHKYEYQRRSHAIASEQLEPGPAPNQALGGKKKGMRFWLIMGTLMIVMFLSAIDLTIISTALPTIVGDLPKSTVPATWVTSSFLLTVTAFQPFMGGLADVIGRRNSLLLSIAFFLGGSVICALAKSMFILVVGRGVQGVGGGGIQAIVEIIISDITTLRERGLYMGALGLVFAVSSLLAPILGGVFSKVDWRWIFWINLPIGGVASVMCIPFLRLNTRPMSLKAALHRMDIFGNMILLGSVVAILIAVTEGGVEHPWTDRQIWLPLALGIVGMIAFFIVEFVPNPLSKDPILPLRLFVHPTAALSFFLTFVHGIVFYGAVYILPVYFQALKDASPLQSAFNLLPATSPSPPAAVIAGLIMAVTGKYKWQMFVWWIVMGLGFGLICLFDADTPKWEWAFFQIIAGWGTGAVFALTLPPIQASLPVSEIAHATATFAFSRSFGSVWGIAISTAIFTSTVAPRLQAIPGTAEIGLNGQTALGFATELRHLPPAMREPVRDAFSYALTRAFIFFVPLCGIGIIACLFLKDIPLPDFNDSQHGIRTSMALEPTEAKEYRQQFQQPEFADWDERKEERKDERRHTHHERKHKEEKRHKDERRHVYSHGRSDSQTLRPPQPSYHRHYDGPAVMNSVESMRTLYGVSDSKMVPTLRKQPQYWDATDDSHLSHDDDAERMHHRTRESSRSKHNRRQQRRPSVREAFDDRGDYQHRF